MTDIIIIITRTSPRGVVGAAGKGNTQYPHPFRDAVPPRHCDRMGVPGERVIGNPTTYRDPHTWILRHLTPLGMFLVSVAFRSMLRPR